MSRDDYKKMMDGVGDFLKVMRANDECKFDKYSIVLYGAEAELVERQVSISKPFTPPAQFTDARSYGTNFNKAFELTLNEIKVSQSRKHVLILMTDGDGQYNEIQRHLEDQTFANVRKGLKMFQCFCVGYGPNCVFSTLESISMLIND